DWLQNPIIYIAGIRHAALSELASGKSNWNTYRIVKALDIKDMNDLFRIEKIKNSTYFRQIVLNTYCIVYSTINQFVSFSKVNSYCESCIAFVASSKYFTVTHTLI